MFYDCQYYAERLNHDDVEWNKPERYHLAVKSSVIKNFNRTIQELIMEKETCNEDI